MPAYLFFRAQAGQPPGRAGSPNSLAPDSASPSGETPWVWKWWQWPHLLSLDAPFVAMTWQWWWSEVYHVGLRWEQRLILGLAVWMIYLADRLSDAARGNEEPLHTDRHNFYAVHKWSATMLLLLVTASLAVLSPARLPAKQFFGGLALLGLVAFYYWMIHHAPRAVRPWIPKEAVVGALFALGSAFFVVCNAPRLEVRLALGIVLFGALCFLNCGLITCWERSPQDLDDPASLLRAFPRVANALPGAALGLAALATGVAVAFGDVGKLPVALSAAGLWVLNRYRAGFSPRVLRVLADFVLFTPFLAASKWFLGR